ncbi:MAG TPA: hypothetical protein VM120_21680 [Bryobacteraceae bacterium]|nr:hypothetical protein [Bryobacteraceae bacterium]
MLVSILTLFYGLFFGEGAAKLFRDSDTGWHILTGEAILKGGPLPRTDPYSFTMAGKPWLAWEWGADVWMGAAHRWNGLPGVAVMYAALVAVCAWLWFRLHAAVGGNFFFACAMASPMLTTVSLHWLARPHVFSWLLCLLALIALERAGGQLRLWHMAAWFLGGVVWANLHASFFLLPILCFTYAAGALLRRLLWAEAVSATKFVWFAVLSSTGTFLNPYGFGLHRHVVEYLSNRELLARVGEFQTFNFQVEGAGQVLLTVVIGMLGVTLTLARRRPEHFLICCGMLILGLRSARALPLVALLVLPLVNGAITRALGNVQVRPKIRNIIDSFLAYSGRLRILERQCGGYAIAPLAFLVAVALLGTPAFSARAGFSPTEFPVQAAFEVEKLPQDARLLAPDKFGGYLIYRFGGQRRVFFDGRSDFYGVGFLKNYVKLIEVRPGWREQAQQFGFTHALLPNRYSLVAALEHWGWRKIYSDETATLLGK